MGIFFTWIILSFIVGFIGSDRKIGFGGAFFISLIFSPLIGLIFTLISKTNAEEKYRESVLETQRSQQESLKKLSESKVTQKNSIADEIEKLQSLKNNNIISEEEFARLKNKIIDSDIHNNDENTTNPVTKEIKEEIQENNAVYSPYKTNPKKEIRNFVISISIAITIIFMIKWIYNTSNDKENNTATIESQSINSVLNESTKSDSSLSQEEKDVVDINSLKNFSYEDVARYTIASVMGQPSSIIKATKKNDYYYVFYIRKSDSQKFDYKVKFIGNRIIWASLDGRWRDSEYDEKISFTEKENKLNIINSYSDGSEGIEEFKKGD